MLYWGKLICWILLLRRTVSCSAAGPLPGLKFSSGLSLSEPKPYKIFQLTTKNQATAREKRFPTFATVNLPLWCRTKDHRQWQPPRLAGHLLARLCRFAAWANDSKMDGWAVGRFLDILADTKKFSFSRTQRERTGTLHGAPSPGWFL